ncbi:hypothetical protein SH467x_001967 [Pirellulaceae bacterium SH467]
MDSGVENVNGTVNELVSDGTIQRILAQVDIVESNSMIEAWWRQLKHQWLYLNDGTGAKVPVDLKEKRATSRAARIAHNRALSCDLCKAKESEPALVSLQHNTS